MGSARGVGLAPRREVMGRSRRRAHAKPSAAEPATGGPCCAASGLSGNEEKLSECPAESQGVCGIASILDRLGRVALGWRRPQIATGAKPGRVL